MKLLTLLLVAFMAFASIATAKADPEPEPNLAELLHGGALAARCHRKNKNAFDAIRKFCYGRSGITVPSNYAKQEKYAGNAFVKIGESSTCNPPQWVPRRYCISQFYQICANKKWGKARFGRNKCQSFHIGTVMLAAKRNLEDRVEIEDLEESQSSVDVLEMYYWCARSGKDDGCFEIE